MQHIVCFLPMQNGMRIDAMAWGLHKLASRIAVEQESRLIALVVHAGAAQIAMDELPFDEVYHVQLDQQGWHLAERHVTAYEAMLDRLNLAGGLYLFAANALYHEAAVRLSARRRGVIVTNAVGLLRDEQAEASWLVRRSIFHGKIGEWVAFPNDCAHRFITFDQAVLAGQPVGGRAEQVVEIAWQPSGAADGPNLVAVRYEGEFVQNAAEGRLSEARCVIGIGRGVYGSDASAMAAIQQLAKLLHAPIGGSKVADEVGLIPRDKRIGSSGHSIEADIYIAIGISGSSQHLAGITGVPHVIAINRDAAAPIFSRCSIGIVGDFREAVPMLIQAIEAQRREGEHAQHQCTG